MNHNLITIRLRNLLRNQKTFSPEELKAIDHYRIVAVISIEPNISNIAFEKTTITNFIARYRNYLSVRNHIIVINIGGEDIDEHIIARYCYNAKLQISHEHEEMTYSFNMILSYLVCVLILVIVKYFV
jgi:archaellum biogenesis ATPase FlaH